MERLLRNDRRHETDSVAMTREVAHTLAEVGFLAAAMGNVKLAAPIFVGLEMFRPTLAYPRIGMAVAFLNAKQASAAVQVLDAKLNEADVEEQSMMDAWRGIALQIAGHRSESERVFRQVVASKTEAASLAAGMLGLEQ